MMHRKAIFAVLIGAFAVGACSSREQGPSAEELERQRIEAEAEARRAQEEAEARARAEAEAERRRLEEERRRAEEAARAEATRRAREIVEELVHFDFDKYNIRPDAEAVLLRKVPILRANPSLRIRIEGHADERGSNEYNLALGERRANAARDFLVGHGIDASRIEVQSFGEERPVDPASNEDAWARNRRAEFRITAGGNQLELATD